MLLIIKFNIFVTLYFLNDNYLLSIIRITIKMSDTKMNNAIFSFQKIDAMFEFYLIEIHFIG